MNITVYLGANAGNDPALAQATAELGRWIGESGNTLVYGGSESGLMGVLAKSVLGAGGKAIGVEPQFFIDEGYEFDGLTELIVTRDMSERKAKMIELGEAFIALPGGTGTLEEITEVMSKVSLRHLSAPCILYDLNGDYEPLRALLRGKVRDALQQGWGRHPQPGTGDEHDGARIGARPGGRGVVHLLHDPEDIGARGLGDALAAVDGQRNGGGGDTGALGNVLICDLSHKKLLLRAHCAVLYLHYTGTPGRMQEGI